MEINLTWSDLKQLLITKILNLQYVEDSIKYKIFVIDNGIVYITKIWKNCNNVSGLNETQNNLDKVDFETNYKTIANKPITPKSKDGKTIIRAESRPLNTTTCFTGKGDSDTDIGKGSELRWDFSNSDGDISAPSGYKRKRIEFKFLDEIYVKEGAVYFFDTQTGSYLDLYIVCPQGQYYYDNNGDLKQASEDTPIAHYVISHWMIGDCPMGDELNTEVCSKKIPNNYKFWLEITVPDPDSTCKGHISLELYRKRTIVL